MGDILVYVVIYQLCTEEMDLLNILKYHFNPPAIL